MAHPLVEISHYIHWELAARQYVKNRVFAVVLHLREHGQEFEEADLFLLETPN